MRAGAILFTFGAAITLAACSSSPSAAPPTTAGQGASATTTTAATPTTSSSGSPSCAVTSGESQPTASLISKAVSLTLTGPVHTGGVAPCIYTTANGGAGAGGIEVNVLFNAPTTQSGLKTYALGAVGSAAELQPLAGVGKLAYSSTANGQDEVFVWESSTVNFSVVVNTSNDTATPLNLTQCEEVAKAVASS